MHHIAARRRSCARLFVHVQQCTRIAAVLYSAAVLQRPRCLVITAALIHQRCSAVCRRDAFCYPY
eukprot:245057-Chlamydomonas_euryale.AAC.2